MVVLMSKGILGREKAPLYGLYRTEKELRIYSWNGDYIILNTDNLYNSLQNEYNIKIIGKIYDYLNKNKTQVTLKLNPIIRAYGNYTERLPTSKIKFKNDLESKKKENEEKMNMFLNYFKEYFEEQKKNSKYILNLNLNYLISFFEEKEKTKILNKLEGHILEEVKIDKYPYKLHM